VSITYLKKASRKAETGQEDVRTTILSMLNELEAGGGKTARRGQSICRLHIGGICVEKLKTAVIPFL